MCRVKVVVVWFCGVFAIVRGVTKVAGDGVVTVGAWGILSRVESVEFRNTIDSEAHG